MKRLKICRCCHSKDLLLYLNLGKQPLANSYHKNEKLYTYPLEVMFCRNCYHNQLSVVVNPDEMYKNYLYVTGTTDTFQRHCEDLAKDAMNRFPKNKLSVLDIACNDGTLLAYFRSLGCEVYAVDPAENLRPITKELGIPVEVDYWTPKIAKKIQKKFYIITGTNVFAHVNNVDEFLTGVKIALKANGILILEFPYANKMVKYNEFDTVYHEHLSYFLVNSFKTLMERNEFYIVDILQTPIHGGSIRFFVKKGDKEHSEKVAKLIQEETNLGLHKQSTYLAFAKRVNQNKIVLRQLLSTLRKNKIKIIGYGASAKGNTMLNYFKINLSYIVDDNPLKWEYLTPGRNIPIMNPNVIRDDPSNLAVIVLSWNFANEIVKKIVTIRGNKNDSIILYVPTVKKISIKSNQKFTISG